MLILSNIEKQVDIIKANYFYPRQILDIGYIEYSVSEHRFLKIDFNMEDSADGRKSVLKTAYIFEIMIEKDDYPKLYRCLGI